MGEIVWIRPEAPPKPALGEACNGCGVCCSAEPCPVGMIVSRRRRGACAALRWDDAERRYRCGLLQRRSSVLHRLAARFIAAGVGCDSDAEVQPAAGG